MNSLGNLSQCMMDSDSEAFTRARRQRRRAIVISIILEALVLGAMLLWPLVTPGVLPHRYILTPLPPYRSGAGGGVTKSSQPSRHHHTPVLNPPKSDHIIYRSPSAANHNDKLSDVAPELPPGSGDADGVGLGLGPGDGRGVPWGIIGDHAGPVIERSHPPAPKPLIRQRKSEGVMAGALIYRVEPKYPRIAIPMGLSGTVRLRAIIAADGTIQHLEVLSGNPILARAAVDAVQQWRYRPTLLSGDPVEVETYITVNFVFSR